MATETLKEVKKALWDKFKNIYSVYVEKGYVNTIEDNLINGIEMCDFEKEFSKKNGNELNNKLKAVHSSAGLVINTFAPLRKIKNDFSVFGFNNIKSIEFEKRLPTGLGGTPPHLDVFIETDDAVIGVESKFTELLGQKPARFADSYNKSKLGYLNSVWFDLIDKYRNGAKSHVDVAQLIKHSIGLIKQYRDNKKFLVYLYWEPLDYKDYSEYRTHKQEIVEVKEDLKKTEINFIPKSYLELWEEMFNQKEKLNYYHELVNRYRIRV